MKISIKNYEKPKFQELEDKNRDLYKKIINLEREILRLQTIIDCTKQNEIST